MNIKRDCTSCKNAKWCLYIHPYIGFYCPGMEKIINNSPRLKEPLAADLIAENYDGFISKDYKEVLNEIGENREQERRRRETEILELPYFTVTELRIKAVAALLYFNIPAMSIMNVLKIARRTFYRMIQKNGE